MCIILIAAMSQLWVICGSKQVLNCIKCVQDLITSWCFPQRVYLDWIIYLICCIQVGVELVLQSLVFFLLVFYPVPLKCLWDSLFLAYLKLS